MADNPLIYCEKYKQFIGVEKCGYLGEMIEEEFDIACHFCVSNIHLLTVVR